MLRQFSQLLTNRRSLYYDTRGLLSYEQLKTAIYRFEKQALEPPVQYRDDEPSPSNLESAQLLGDRQSQATNEKVFIRLLDQELHKITEFYVEKERELLGDVVILNADIERMEEEQSGLSGHGGGGGATSGGSDSEDGGEDSDGVDDTVATRFRRSMEGVFSNPRKYDAAARKARTKRAGSSTSQGRATRRSRALSNASRGSRASDLLDLEEEPTEQATGPTSADVPALDGDVPAPQRPALGRIKSRRREPSSTGLAADDDDDTYGRSDWAIDMQIMYKRRIAALFTVSSINCMGVSDSG